MNILKIVLVGVVVLALAAPAHALRIVPGVYKPKTCGLYHKSRDGSAKPSCGWPVVPSKGKLVW